MKKQCGWATPHGGDGFLCCCHEPGHEGEAFHATAYEIPGMGAYPAPTAEQDAQRTWCPEWFWRAVLEQDRGRARRGYVSMETKTRQSVRPL